MVQAARALLDGMKSITEMMQEGESKTAMPQPKAVEDDLSFPMENDVDMTASLRDVTDLYPCMIVMCGSAGGCMTVSINYMAEHAWKLILWEL